MRRIRSEGMKPEIAVRRLAHRLGFRFRLHSRNLPGKPDLVFPRRRKVVFVHGCFWHQHRNCKVSRIPKSNTEYWIPKLERNKERDLEIKTALRKLHWKCLVVWECQTENIDGLSKALLRFLK